MIKEPTDQQTNWPTSQPNILFSMPTYVLSTVFVWSQRIEYRICVYLSWEFLASVQKHDSSKTNWRSSLIFKYLMSLIHKPNIRIKILELIVPRNMTRARRFESRLWILIYFWHLFFNLTLTYMILETIFTKFSGS